MTIFRADIYRAIWFEAAPRKIAERLAITPTGLAKMCDRLNIPRPPAGYWMARHKAARTSNPRPRQKRVYDPERGTRVFWSSEKVREWTVPPLPPGPDTAVVLNPQFRGKQVLPFDGPDPLASGPLADELARARHRDTRLWVAFWFEIGTNLPAESLNKLQWTHVKELKGGGWRLAGPLGRRGKMLKCDVSPRAVEALRPFRRDTGPVIRHAADRYRRLPALLGPKDWRRRVLELRRVLEWKIRGDL